MDRERNNLIPERAGTPADNRLTNRPSYSIQPKSWQSISVPAEWLDKLEAMLLSSAMLTGAATDDAAIIELAKRMAPALMQLIPFDRLDEVYERAITMKLLNPDSKAVMINAHDLLSTWYTLNAQEAAKLAAEAAERKLAYRAAQEAELRRKPRKLHHISELAQRDGVQVPWEVGSPGAPIAPEQPVEPLRTLEGAEAEAARRRANADELEALEGMERVQRNREAWYRLAAEDERIQRAQEQAKGERNDEQQTKNRRTDSTGQTKA